MITLAQAKVGMADKVDQMVIDEFRRGSMLLDMLNFDDSVSPGTGGSTLVYGYIKTKTPSTASFRALNSEYTNNEAIREEATASLKIFGGSFKLDRVIINTSGAVDELGYQMQEKIKAAINLFHYTAINGDAATSPQEFDGLDVFLTGSTTEYNTAANIDLSTIANIKTNYESFMHEFTKFLRLLKGKPNALLMNSDMYAVMVTVARLAGYLTQIEDAFGREVNAWNGIPFVDLEEYWDGSQSLPVIPISQEAGFEGTTDIYAVITEGNDGFIGASPTGSKLVETTLPDMSQAGAVKEGDVEMVAAVVLKNSKKAGVFRRIKVV